MFAAQSNYNSYRQVLDNVVHMNSWKAHRQSVVRREGELPEPPKCWVLSPGADVELASCFKVHITLIDRWLVCDALPSNLQYDEWIYFDNHGVPSMYWHNELEGIILI